MPAEYSRSADDYYKAIDPKIEQSFTFEQKREIQRLLERYVPAPKKQLFGISFSNRLLKPVYLNFDWGAQSSAALPAPGSKNHFHGLLTILKLSIAGLTVLLAFLALFWIAYEVKSALGIDLFPDKHLSDFIRFQI